LGGKEVSLKGGRKISLREGLRGQTHELIDKNLATPVEDVGHLHLSVRAEKQRVMRAADEGRSDVSVALPHARS